MATRVGVDWPLSSGLELGALPTAASCGRLHAKNVVYEWGLEHLSYTVELLVSELVTNALRASELIPGPVIPPIRLRLSSDRAVVLIEVWDGNMQRVCLSDRCVIFGYSGHAVRGRFSMVAGS